MNNQTIKSHVTSNGCTVKYELLSNICLIWGINHPSGSRIGTKAKGIRQFISFVSKNREVTHIQIDSEGIPNRVLESLSGIGFKPIDADIIELSIRDYIINKSPKATVIGRDVHELMTAYQRVRGKAIHPPRGLSNVLVSLGEYLLDKNISDADRYAIERDFDELTF